MDRKRVLLAEDDPDTRFLLAMVLSEHGYDVIAAPDGVEALALAERQAPDLMVVDQMMPRMTGTDCLSVMRAHPLLRTVPTVMVTAAAASSKGLNRFASMPWSRSRWNWKVSFGRCARCARLAPSDVCTGPHMQSIAACHRVRTGILRHLGFEKRTPPSSLRGGGTERQAPHRNHHLSVMPLPVSTSAVPSNSTCKALKFASLRRMLLLLLEIGNRLGEFG